MHKIMNINEKNPLNLIFEEENLLMEGNDIGKYFLPNYYYDINKLSTIIFIDTEGIYYNQKTGEKNKDVDKIISKDENYLIFKRRKKEKYKFYFFEYDEKYNVIIHFSCLYIKELNSELWSWKNIKARGIITEVSNYYYRYYDEHECDIFPIVNLNYYDAKSDTYMKKKVFHSETQNILNKCFGNGYTNTYLKNDNFNFIQNINDVLRFNYGNNEISINSKAQQIIDENEFKDFSINARKKIVEMMNCFLAAHYKTEENKSKYDVKAENHYDFLMNSEFYRFAVIETLKNEVAVIRMFLPSVKNDETYFEKDSFVFDDLLFFEYARIFVDKYDINIATNMNSKWFTFKTNTFVNIYDYPCIILDLDEDVLNKTKLKHYKTFFDENNRLFEINKIPNKGIIGFKENRCLFENIYNMIAFPLVESLLKLNIDFFITPHQNIDITVLMQLKNAFEDCNVTEPDIQKSIGCPLYMLKYISEHKEKENLIYILKFLKYIFKDNQNYLKSMNKNLFVKILDEFLFLKKSSNFISFEVLKDILYYLIKIYGTKNIMSKILYLKKIKIVNDEHVEKEKNYGEHIYAFFTDIYSVYKDYLKMVYEMKDVFDGFSWKFKTAEEIVSAHEAIVPIYVSFDNGKYKLFNDSFIDKQKEWSNYNFKTDSFSIVIPSLPSDFVIEGELLHHCVKSYIDNIADGITTILFIRKNENLKKPFFTLEVKNGEIIQCHGFANCNTNIAPGLDDFIKSFCMEKNIIYSKGEKILAAAN